MIKLRYALICLLCLAVISFAQSTIPVEWSEARQIGAVHELHESTQMVPMGDTLVFSMTEYETGIHRNPYTCYSYDNGMTVSAWFLMDDQVSNADFLNIAGSNGRVIAFLGNSEHDWLKISENGGANWSNIMQWGSGVGLYHIGFSLGDTLFRARRIPVNDPDFEAIDLRTSLDGGQTWSQGVIFDTLNYPLLSRRLVVTHSRLLLIARNTNNPENRRRLSYTIGYNRGASWTHDTNLPDQPYYIGAVSGLQEVTAAADTESETVIIASYWSSAVILGDLWLTRSIDGGDSWESPMNLSNSGLALAPTGGSHIFCRGKLWGVAWQAGLDSALYSVFWSMSANHGKTWYPPQLVVFDNYAAPYTIGQFVGDEVRLYYTSCIAENCTEAAFFTVNGIVTPDSTLPELIETIHPSDTVEVGDTLHFQIEVTDNDTLSRVAMGIIDHENVLVLMDLDTVDYGSYEATFIVPRTGRYRYWYEAEDYWENVGTLPVDTSFAFVTNDYNEAAEQNPSIASDWSIGVYPNPFNAETTIELEVEHQFGTVDLKIYNTLGQVVHSQSLPVMGSKMKYRWDGKDISSGIYFVTAAVGETRKVVKVVAVK
jgi:hypothetical protein